MKGPLKSAMRVSAVDGFERIVTVRPAFDRRDPDPSKNYGIHGCDLTFVLKGERGATYFVVFTNWYLPHVAREFRSKVQHDYNPFEPTGCEVGYHSPTPQFEGQLSRNAECEYLDGKPCYCDSSASAADPLLAKLIAKGDEAVWTELRRWYNERFPSLVSSQTKKERGAGRVRSRERAR